MNTLLNLPISSLNGVGKKRAALYSKLGLNDINSLLHHFPNRYINCSNPLKISQAIIGEKCCIKATILKSEKPYVKSRKMIIYTSHGADSDKNCVAIVFFNNIYAFKSLKIGHTYLFFGKIEGNIISKKIINPMIINPDESSLIPIYSLTSGLTSKMISTNIKQALNLIDGQEDCLPQKLIDKYGLIAFNDALKNIHFPQSEQHLNRAKQRLIFEELLYWQIGIQLIKQQNTIETTKKLTYLNLDSFLNNLKFELTNAQNNVINECISDCLKNVPMNRLIQGDVGCGKTVVAAALAFLFAKSKMQVAIMAPTDILARQHFKFFVKTLTPLGINVNILVGSLSSKEKSKVQNELEYGMIDVIIGTHSLFQEKTNFKNLGLIITDEQHRFGVEQRKKLAEKGNAPHKLVMSATPIPRTLALIIYGDLDISNIYELPAGRIPVKTVHIPSSKRSRAFSYIKNQLQKQRQAYIVCPAIDDSERNIASVVKYTQNLQQNIFKDYSVEMLHGKMTGSEKDILMQKFLNGQIDILVSTTVIEVGVDVPNATTIMIENAEFFGLSQLHQLRGRVGRGNIESLCILVSNATKPESQKRLKIMCDTNNGFEIAEEDLKIRGPGDFFGNKQHGLPNFKIANIIEDTKILNVCKKEAENILSNDPRLELKEHEKIKNNVLHLFSHDKYIL